MVEIDPIIKDLGASVSALRPQESYSCTNHSLSMYKNMGLLIILFLVLVLTFQKSFIWPSILPQTLLTSVFVLSHFTRKRTK